LVMSDIYRVENGHLVFDTYRPFQNTSMIKLSQNSIYEIYLYTYMAGFFPFLNTRFKSVVDLDLLTVTGNVYFGRACDLRGTVLFARIFWGTFTHRYLVAATEGHRIDIPDGSILEDRTDISYHSSFELRLIVLAFKGLLAILT
ncbi:hypothetical protein BDP27DRAFT_1232523, partial [Rhodocollybia butyracea]